jgi:hypothetical protein
VLAYAGNNAFNDTLNHKSLLGMSSKYSLTVNVVIWIVFISITLIESESKDRLLVVIPPMIAFIICVASTTFTVGMVICYIIRSNAGRQIIAN